MSRMPQLPLGYASWNHWAKAIAVDERLSLRDRYGRDWRRLREFRLYIHRRSRGPVAELAVAMPDCKARQALMLVAAKLSMCGCRVLGRATTRCRRVGVILIARGDGTDNEIHSAVLAGMTEVSQINRRSKNAKGE